MSPWPPGSSSRSSAQPCGQLLESLGKDVVVGPQAATLGVDDAGLAQLLEVVRERGLGDVEQRHELAHADLAGVLAQHVHELEADRVAERLGDLGDADRVLALDVRIDHRLATGLARRALGLGCQREIDSHLFTSIDSSDVCQCNMIWAWPLRSSPTSTATCPRSRPRSTASTSWGSSGSTAAATWSVTARTP